MTTAGWSRCGRVPAVGKAQQLDRPAGLPFADRVDLRHLFFVVEA